MKVFYDTEFWERGPDKPITLISVGAVTDDGDELYLINFNAPLREIVNESPWLRKNVLSQLPVRISNVKNDWGDWFAEWDETHPDINRVWAFNVIGPEFYRFVNQGLGPIELWARYGAYDHVVMSQLFGRMIDKPVNMPWYTRELQREIDRLSNPPLPEQSDGLHNALEDARHVKVIYDHLHCAHCGGLARGYAKRGDQRLCHPSDGVDCYRLVTLYKHTTPCRSCATSRTTLERG